MAQEMSTAQFDHWIRDLSRFGTKWGLIPEHKKIGKYLRDTHRSRLRAHVGPSGVPWKPAYHKPMPKVGDVAPMTGPRGGVGRGRIVAGRIRNVAERHRAVAFRKRFGPPAKKVPALIRTRKAPGSRKAREILDFLSKPGRSIRITRVSLTYGYTPGTRWIQKAVGGGVSRRFRRPIPRREVVGLNRHDLRVIDGIYFAGLEKRLAKRRIA